MSEVNVSYYCPYCENETTIVVQATGPNDYVVVDECCSNCDAGIEGGVIDKMVHEAVQEHFENQGEFYHDLNDLD